MKKIIALTAAVLALAASASFAAFSVNPTLGSASNGGTLAIQTSKNVMMDYLAQTTGLGYLAGTYHTSGTKTYGTSSGDPKLYVSDGTGGTLPTTAPSGSESANWGTSFSTM